MRRWALIRHLAHRRWVMAFWLLVIVIGAAVAGASVEPADRSTSRCPASPAPKLRRRSDNFRQRRGHQPVRRHRDDARRPDDDRPRGRRSPRPSPRSAHPCPTCASSTRRTRGDQGIPHAKDDRTAYALVFYSRSIPSPTATAADRPDPGSRRHAAPAARRDRRCHRRGRAGCRRRRSGRAGRARRDPARRRRCAARAPVRVRLVPVVAAARRGRRIDSGHVHPAVADHLLTDVSFIVEFLVALVGLGVAIDYSLLLVTRWREERDSRPREPRSGCRRDADGRACGAVQWRHRCDRPARARSCCLSRSCAAWAYGGALIPLASVRHHAQLHAGDPRRHRPEGRLAEAAPRETAPAEAWSRWARLVVKTSLDRCAGRSLPRSACWSACCSASRSARRRPARWPTTVRPTTRCAT